METKKIVESLRSLVNYQGIHHFYHTGKYGDNFPVGDVIDEAAERLEELEAEIAKLKQQLSEKQPEWISVENGKEMPDAFSYTGIRHNQFPRLVVAIDENSHVTHWMMLDAPKPKEPSFKDVFLEKFPKAIMYNDGIPLSCRASIFGGKCSLGSTKCFECWNQPYFEPQEEGEADGK